MDESEIEIKAYLLNTIKGNPSFLRIQVQIWYDSR